MIQWLLDQTVKLAQYGQGVGAAGRARSRTDDAALRRLNRSGSGPLVIFDVGANRGRYADRVLAHFRKRALMIHAFEPSRVAFAELARRFAGLNDMVLNNLALGAAAGEQTLYCDVAGSELSSLYARKLEQHGIQMTQSELVRVETLDRYCESKGIATIDLLKLDVEGHELEVLKGGVRLFERKAIGMVSFEFGGCNVDSRTFVRDFYHFFAAYGMPLARVSAFGALRPISGYTEGLEQFRTTCFVASQSQGR